MIRLIAIFCLIAAPLLAGPWMREEGGQFLSVSADFGLGGGADGYGALYYEFGLEPRWTLGIDAGGKGNGETTALVFARTPLWRSPQGARLAATLALGSHRPTGGHGVPALRAGLAWGRGIDPGLPGWMALELSHQWRGGGLAAQNKLEATLGLRWRHDREAMLQVTAEKTAGQAVALSLAPAVVWQVGEAGHLVTGLRLRDDGAAALTVALWRRF
ncbi:hypothetical protein [Shimia sp.]|uniref:hypothetical protein n=1 Tax=Shimia sp. TaxID=1954381 RepID=UPI003567CB40